MIELFIWLIFKSVVILDVYKRQVIGKVQLFKSGDGSDYAANFADLFKEKNETAAEVLLSVHYKGPGLGEGSCFGVCWSGPMNAIEGTMNLCDDFYCIEMCIRDSSTTVAMKCVTDFSS